MWRNLPQLTQLGCNRTVEAEDGRACGRRLTGGHYVVRKTAEVASLHRGVGESLAAYRDAASLSQGAVARATNYDRTSICHIEAGRQFPLERAFWEAADLAVGAHGAVLAQYDRASSQVLEIKKAELVKLDEERLARLNGLARGVTKSTVDGTADGADSAVAAIRIALMDCRQLSPFLSPATDGDPPSLPALQYRLASVLDAYQASQFEFAASHIPLLLADILLATRKYGGPDQARANELLALCYQAAASVLVKLGASGLAWISAERGLVAAQQTENLAIIGSLFRSVSFALLSTGFLVPAMQLAEAGAEFLRPHLSDGDGALLSTYGMLFLAGSMASSRSGDRAMTRSFVPEVEKLVQNSRGRPCLELDRLARRIQVVG